ncbi:MAG: prolyl oligopeptidase family serine peptidase [Actinobacteria bacterium]|nr:prolyl oligopeptidase family serine peptidase [Actinomycetota bacterium]
MPYKLPPPDILEAAEAPAAPFLQISPAGGRALVVEYQMHPPIEVLSRPLHKLGGARIDPSLKGRERQITFTGLGLLTLDGGDSLRVKLPTGGSLGRVPVWSPNGARFAFTVDADDGIELWIGDPETGRVTRLGDLLINDALVPMRFSDDGQAFRWLPDGSLLVHLAVDQGPPPATPEVPSGPRVEDTAGKRSQMATFQDLLTTPLDEDLFEHFGTIQLAIVDPSSGRATEIGPRGIYTEAEPSPSGEYILVTELHRPFSYRVRYEHFSRTVKVWDRAGEIVAPIADLPVSDEIPRHGVHTGPRRAHWQENRPSSVVWAEALDGGDPTQPAEFRDRVMRLEIPSVEPEHLLDIKHRVVAWQWLEAVDEGLYTEWDRDRRWRSTHHIDLTAPEKAQKIIDISMNERYGDPGWPVTDVRPDGSRVVAQDRSRIFLAGQGQTPERALPFLRTLDLFTLDAEELFRCDDDFYESFVGFASPARDRIITRREAPTETTNYFLIEPGTGEREQITHFPDPHPQITGVDKRIVRYRREDGVELSAMLYLPPGYRPDNGERLPVLIWAYPLDYSDPDTAGQVMGSDRAFTRLRGATPLWMLMRGWAVLMDAKMPIIGDPETMNDTFIEQVVDAAKAAVDALDELGVADRERVAVSGHSYGGFMTASLMAHTDLFAAGVARSGAYNRSLTPFGFQTERRNYWEVPHIYQRVSPFTYAHQITAPLLLIHGEDDANSGTFPVQSERLFQAIQGNGGTARLVILPKEGHSYRARESVLHAIAETVEWLETHVGTSPLTKNKA